MPLVDALPDVVGERQVLGDADVRAPYEVDGTRRWSGRAEVVLSAPGPAAVNELG